MDDPFFSYFRAVGQFSRTPRVGGRPRSYDELICLAHVRPVGRFSSAPRVGSCIPSHDRRRPLTRGALEHWPAGRKYAKHWRNHAELCPEHTLGAHACPPGQLRPRWNQIRPSPSPKRPTSDETETGPHFAEFGPHLADIQFRPTPAQLGRLTSTPDSVDSSRIWPNLDDTGTNLAEGPNWSEIEYGLIDSYQTWRLLVELGPDLAELAASFVHFARFFSRFRPAPAQIRPTCSRSRQALGALDRFQPASR